MMSAFSSLQTVPRHSNFPLRTGGKLEEIQSRRRGAAGGNQNCSIKIVPFTVTTGLKSPRCLTEAGLVFNY